MNRDELIDIYDENMNHLGTAPRSQAHHEGLWHMTFHCWIVSRPDKIWLQRRGEHVETHPNKLDKTDQTFYRQKNHRTSRLYQP